MEKQNPFESLRQPGIRGEDVISGCKSTTIFAAGEKAALQISTAELLPGVYGFGFYLHLDGVTRQMYPGEGSGWFRSEDDAMLYALGYIRYGAVDIPEDMKFAIDAAISRIRNVSLFDDLD